MHQCTGMAVQNEFQQMYCKRPEYTGESQSCFIRKTIEAFQALSETLSWKIVQFLCFSGIISYRLRWETKRSSCHCAVFHALLYLATFKSVLRARNKFTPPTAGKIVNKHTLNQVEVPVQVFDHPSDLNYLPSIQSQLIFLFCTAQWCQLYE